MGAVLQKAWLVRHEDGWQSIQDAPTAGKAKWQDFREFWTDSVSDFFQGLSCVRRKDLDGLTEDDARYVVWPCKQRPCPGCCCCEDGWCRDEDIGGN